MAETINLSILRIQLHGAVMTHVLNIAVRGSHDIRIVSHTNDHGIDAIYDAVEGEIWQAPVLRAEETEA